MPSTDFYNNHAQAFYEGTIGIDMSAPIERFLFHLPAKAHILDAGCGVGRDTKSFLQKGHSAVAFDASSEMVRLARQETGQQVLELRLQEMDFDDAFDGVWAQASLLHVPYNQMRGIFAKIHRALKPSGILFCSYKYGEDYMRADERDFYNMTETSILPYLQGLFEPINLWQRPARSQTAIKMAIPWLYVLCKKLP